MPRQTGHAERRRHQRVPAPIPFHLLADGKDEPFDLVDLSESGVRISAPRSLTPMTRIQVRMILQEFERSRALARDHAGVVKGRHQAHAALLGERRQEAVVARDGDVSMAIDDHGRSCLRTAVSTLRSASTASPTSRPVQSS